MLNSNYIITLTINEKPFTWLTTEASAVREIAEISYFYACNWLENADRVKMYVNGHLIDFKKEDLETWL